MKTIPVRCRICSDVRFIATDDGMVECSCTRTAQSQKAITKSGLGLKYRDCTLDNYNPAHSTQKRAKEEVARWLGRLSNITDRCERGLVLHGKPGNGKTHLLAAAFKESLSMAPANRLPEAFATMYYSHDFVAALKRGIGRGAEAEMAADDMLDFAGKVPVLFIDDIGAERTTGYVLECFNQVFHRRDRECLPTFMTTNLSPEGLVDAIGERMHSRITGNCDFIAVEGPDHRQNKTGGGKK